MGGDAKTSSLSNTNILVLICNWSDLYCILCNSEFEILLFDFSYTQDLIIFELNSIISPPSGRGTSYIPFRVNPKLKEAHEGNENNGLHELLCRTRNRCVAAMAPPQREDWIVSSSEKDEGWREIEKRATRNKGKNNVLLQSQILFW